MADVERCGETLDGEMWPIGECCLSAGHLGDHYAVVTWPQRRWAEPGEQTAAGAMLQKMWAPVLDRQLRLPLVVGPQTVLPPPTGI